MKWTGVFAGNPIERINLKDIYAQTHVDFSIGDFSYIKPYAFRDFNSLDKLVVSCGLLNKLEAGSFVGLKNLKHLTICRGNFMNEIEPHAFMGLDSLEVLEINYCKGTNLALMQSDTFKGMPNLRTLSFECERCVLTNVDCKYFKLNSQNMFVYLENLQEIFFKSIPLPNIEENFFYGLNNAKKIHACLNGLKSIDVDGLHGLNKLEAFCSEKNEINTVNLQSFANLSRLSKVSLEANQIQKIDNSRGNSAPLGHFSNLEYLNLKYNKIVRLEQGYFQNMFHLKELNLEGNQMCSIEANTFAPLVQLTHLNLSNNALTEIQVDTFKGLIELQVLDLSCNRICIIQCGSFENFKKLRKLDLMNNICTILQTK